MDFNGANPFSSNRYSSPFSTKNANNTWDWIISNKPDPEEIASVIIDKKIEEEQTLEKMKKEEKKNFQRNVWGNMKPYA